MDLRKKCIITTSAIVFLLLIVTSVMGADEMFIPEKRGIYRAKVEITPNAFIYFGRTLENNTSIFLDLPFEADGVFDEAAETQVIFSDTCSFVRSITDYIDPKEHFYIYDEGGVVGKYQFKGFALIHSTSSGDGYWYIHLVPERMKHKLSRKTAMPIALFSFKKEHIVFEVKTFKRLTSEAFAKKLRHLSDEMGDAVHYYTKYYQLQNLENLLRIEIGQIQFYEGEKDIIRIFRGNKELFTYEGDYFG